MGLSSCSLTREEDDFLSFVSMRMKIEYTFTFLICSFDKPCNTHLIFAIQHYRRTHTNSPYIVDSSFLRIFVVNLIETYMHIDFFASFCSATHTHTHRISITKKQNMGGERKYENYYICMFDGICVEK